MRFFYIQKGSVKLTVLSEQGKEAVVGILEPGQFFGEGCLNGHPLRIATTTAMCRAPWKTAPSASRGIAPSLDNRGESG
jgi:CRP-like cAMP-binding protein